MVAQLDMIVYYDHTLEGSRKTTNFSYTNFEMIKLPKDHVRMKAKYQMTLDQYCKCGNVSYVKIC